MGGGFYMTKARKGGAEQGKEERESGSGTGNSPLTRYWEGCVLAGRVMWCEWECV